MGHAEDLVSVPEYHQPVLVQLGLWDVFIVYVSFCARIDAMEPTGSLIFFYDHMVIAP